ncbi:MAG TPA: hypothetical protein VJM57_00565 [Thermodesulfobacteriota bacterium]|nr:hypothetical protein [Thermodesulfobacteriota bacterium]
MALTLMDIGADEILKTYFNNARPAGGNNLTIKLFTNNVTPADTDTAGTYTEATGGGYAAKTITNGSWTVTVGNDPSDAAYAQQTWTFTGALTTNPTIYGYYVVDADGTLLWAEKLAASFTPANNGDELKITPKFQLSKGTPS